MAVCKACKLDRHNSWQYVKHVNYILTYSELKLKEGTFDVAGFSAQGTLSSPCTAPHREQGRTGQCRWGHFQDEVIDEDENSKMASDVASCLGVPQTAE